METYYKNTVVQTEERANELLSAMDEFVATGKTLEFGNGKPILDLELTKIWNQGNGHLSWEWSEETQQEIDQRESQDQADADKIAAYKSDPELFLNEKIRPWRDWALVEWVDKYAGRPLLWESLDSEMQTKIRDKRDELLGWPATFTKYVTDQTIESKKPAKPSYVTE